MPEGLHSRLTKRSLVRIQSCPLWARSSAGRALVSLAFLSLALFLFCSPVSSEPGYFTDNIKDLYQAFGKASDYAQYIYRTEGGYYIQSSSLFQPGESICVSKSDTSESGLFIRYSKHSYRITDPKHCKSKFERPKFSR